MNQEIPNAEAMLQTLIKQEEALQFERFTFDNAWQLVLVLRSRPPRRRRNVEKLVARIP